MSENNAANLRELTREEVELKMQDLLEEIQNLKLMAGLKQEQNPLHMRVIRRDLARVKTILHEDATGLRKLAGSKEK